MQSSGDRRFLSTFMLVLLSQMLPHLPCRAVPLWDDEKRNTPRLSLPTREDKVADPQCLSCLHVEATLSTQEVTSKILDFGSARP